MVNNSATQLLAHSGMSNANLCYYLFLWQVDSFITGKLMESLISLQVRTNKRKNREEMSQNQKVAPPMTIQKSHNIGHVNNGCGILW